MTARDSLSRQVETAGQITAHRPCLTYGTATRIECIVRDMHGSHQGAVGILDASRRLVGLLTERDILRGIFGTHGETRAEYDRRHHKMSIYPESLVARDVMTTNPVCLYEDMPVEEALEQIKQNGFRFMPVVATHDAGKLRGIVSERELFWRTQEKLRRTVKMQESMLSYFISEPYGGASMEFTR